MTTPTLTRDEAAAAIRGAAWTETPGLDAAGPRLLEAVKAVWHLCHDPAGNWLPGTAGVPVRELTTVLGQVGELPKQRTIVHCFAGIGADWPLDAALDLVASAQIIKWDKHLFNHDLLVIAPDGQRYRFDVAMPGRGDR